MILYLVYRIPMDFEISKKTSDMKDKHNEN